MRIKDEHLRIPLPASGPITAPDDVVALDDELVEQIRRAALEGIDCVDDRLLIPLEDQPFDHERLGLGLRQWLALADALARFAEPEQVWCVARALDPECPVDAMVDAVHRLRDLEATALVEHLGERLRRTRGIARPLAIARALGDEAAAAAVLDAASAGDGPPDATDSELFEIIDGIFTADPDPALLDRWSRHRWPGVRLAALLVAPDALPTAARAALVDDPAPRVAAAARQQTLDRSPPDVALPLAREMLARPLPSPDAPDWRVLDAALDALDLIGREGSGDDVPLLEAVARRPHLGPAAEAAERQIKARFSGRRGVLSLVEDDAQGRLSEVSTD